MTKKLEARGGGTAFELDVEPGSFRNSQIIVMLGENGTGNGRRGAAAVVAAGAYLAWPLDALQEKPLSSACWRVCWLLMWLRARSR